MYDKKTFKIHHFQKIKNIIEMETNIFNNLELILNKKCFHSISASK